MTREQLRQRWLNECDPEHIDCMVEMLSTLDFNELARYFYLMDSKAGLTLGQIAVKYNVSRDSVSYQLIKAKKYTGFSHSKTQKDRQV